MKSMVSDETLRAAVIKELEDDKEVGAKHISVIAIDGAVTLGGHVMTIHEKHAAVRAAERAEAVRAVADEIEVRDPSLHQHTDDEIAEGIAHLRSWGTEIPDSVAAQVRDGGVILHGEVESVSQRDAAESAVRQLAGVRAVANLMKVKGLAEPSAADVEHRVHEAIAQTADRYARTVRVAVSDGVAHLSGQVPSSAALQVALKAVESIPGVTAVDNEIVVSAPDA
jgi:osmotically-inducible protein OsmY